MHVAKSSNDPLKDEKEPGLRLNRRDWLVGVGAVAGAGLVGSLAGIHDRNVSFGKLRAENRELYGKLDNPRFRVDERLGLLGTRSHQSVLHERIEMNDMSKEHFDKFESALRGLEEALGRVEGKRRSSVPTSKNVSERDLLREVDALINNTQIPSTIESREISESITTIKGGVARLEAELLLEGSQRIDRLLGTTDQTLDQNAAIIINNRSSHTELQRQLGDPETYTRELIRRVTGLPFPDTATFEIKAIDDPKRSGYSIFTTQSIVTTDGHYAHVVLVNAHEAGHLMALHSESSLYDREPRNKDEVRNWEEACAYAFQAVASEAIQEPEISAMAKLLMVTAKDGLLDQFYREEASQECHRVGMAYFDAALTVLGSASKAFNYLSSHKKLSPAMTEVIKVNKDLYEASLRKERPRCVKIETRLREINKRLAEY